MKLFSNTATTKSIYTWNMIGSFSNATFSVVVIMITTRIMSAFDADIFNVGWSISQLMATLGTFQVRMYQSTDINGKFCFKQYFQFRLISLATMMVVSVGYIIYLDYEVYKSLVVLMVCLFRAIECFADVYEGWFQQKKRLDISGKATFLRVFVCVLFLGMSSFFTNNLIIICTILIVSFLMSFYFFDVRVFYKIEDFQDVSKTIERGWIKELIKDTFPLFINSFFMMSIINTPKMAIDTAIEMNVLTNGAQTIYNILFMPASFLTLFYIVFRPLVTEMAIQWDNKNIKGFNAILRRIIFVLFGFSIVVIILAYWLGCPVLSIFYGLNLHSYSIELIIIILGGCLYTFSCVMDNALIVIRKQYVLIVSYVVTWILSNIVCASLVYSYGILGAGISYMISMAVFTGVMSVLFFVFYRKERNKIQ